MYNLESSILRCLIDRNCLGKDKMYFNFIMKLDGMLVKFFLVVVKNNLKLIK